MSSVFESSLSLGLFFSIEPRTNFFLIVQDPEMVTRNILGSKGGSVITILSHIEFRLVCKHGRLLE